MVKNQGRPRDETNEIYIQYRDAKRNFRREQRRRTIEYETKCMETLSETQELDQKLFWHLVNKRRKKCQIHPILNDTWELCTDPDDIRLEWNDAIEICLWQTQYRIRWRF